MASPTCSTSTRAGSTRSSSSSAPVEGDERETLEQLVREHAEETGSTVAEELLDDWPASLDRFTEVIPRDFRIVMEAKAKAEADGGRGTPPMMEALHG